MWGLGGELAKCFHYVAWVPVLLGMWWFRRRVFQEPGMWVLLVLCALSTLGLLRLAVEVGYMSDRHVMLVVMCGCYAAAAAVWELPGRWSAWRQARKAWFKKGSGTFAGTAPRVLRTKVPDPYLNHVRPGLLGSGLSAVLLVCMIAASVPKSLERLHANRAGHHAAGLWFRATRRAV